MVFAGKPDLLARFRKGDGRAFEAVYWAYVDRVTRIVQAVWNSYVTASNEQVKFGATELGDLVQEVFARAFSPQCRLQYDGNRAYGPYVGQIARNTVADHWRVIRRHVALDVASLLDAISLERDNTEQTLERWADQETIAIVERYVASLEPDVRRVHEALYVQGLSQRDAAAALGLGRQAVRGIEARLQAGLRRELKRTGQLPHDNVLIDPAPSAARGELRFSSNPKLHELRIRGAWQNDR
jgi:RNA polymerase sigma factor (sigma-70 family)